MKSGPSVDELEDILRELLGKLQRKGDGFVVTNTISPKLFNRASQLVDDCSYWRTLRDAEKAVERRPETSAVGTDFQQSGVPSPSNEGTKP